MSARDDFGCSRDYANQVLSELARLAGTDGTVPFSLTALADTTRASYVNAARAIRVLTSLARIERLKRGTGNGYPSIYRVIDASLIPEGFPALRLKP